MPPSLNQTEALLLYFGQPPLPLPLWIHSRRDNHQSPSILTQRCHRHNSQEGIDIFCSDVELLLLIVIPFWSPHTIFDSILVINFMANMIGKVQHMIHVYLWKLHEGQN